MALALKKKKEDEEREKNSVATSKPEETLPSTTLSTSPSAESKEPDERGRRIDKGKVRVVGFDGANQDGDIDE